MSRAEMILAVAIASLAPSAIGAQEPAFTFEVPVDLTGLHPDINRVNVFCYVGSELPAVGEEITSAGQQWGDLEMGGGFVGVARDGSARGTIRVGVGASAPQLWRMQAQVYRCRLHLSGESDGTAVNNRPQEGTPTTEQEARFFARPGTLVAVVEGTLPGG